MARVRPPSFRMRRATPCCWMVVMSPSTQVTHACWSRRGRRPCARTPSRVLPPVLVVGALKVGEPAAVVLDVEVVAVVGMVGVRGQHPGGQVGVDTRPQHQDAAGEQGGERGEAACHAPTVPRPRQSAVSGHTAHTLWSLTSRSSPTSGHHHCHARLHHPGRPRSCVLPSDQPGHRASQHHRVGAVDGVGGVSMSDLRHGRCVRITRLRRGKVRWRSSTWVQGTGFRQWTGPPSPRSSNTRWPRLRTAHNSRTTWLTTVNKDGSPHVTAVGALWLDGAFWFQTGSGTRKGRNITAIPALLDRRVDPRRGRRHRG